MLNEADEGAVAEVEVFGVLKLDEAAYSFYCLDIIFICWLFWFIWVYWVELLTLTCTTVLKITVFLLSTGQPVS